jgi:K+-transporting ATPase KdpF subunit
MNPTLDDLVVLLVAIGLLGYLVFVLLEPEKF